MTAQLQRRHLPPLSLEACSWQLSMAHGYPQTGQYAGHPTEVPKSRGSGFRHLGCQWAGTVDHKSRERSTNYTLDKPDVFHYRAGNSFKKIRSRTEKIRCCHWKSLIESRATTANAAPTASRIYAVLDRRSAEQALKLSVMVRTIGGFLCSGYQLLTASRW